METRGIGSYGGRVAKLQKRYADQARLDTRYVDLDEKEIGETLGDWLVERRGLQPEMAKKLATDLAESWGRGQVLSQCKDCLACTNPSISSNLKQDFMCF